MEGSRAAVRSRALAAKVGFGTQARYMKGTRATLNHNRCQSVEGQNTTTKNLGGQKIVLKRCDARSSPHSQLLPVGGFVRLSDTGRERRLTDRIGCTRLAGSTNGLKRHRQRYLTKYTNGYRSRPGWRSLCLIILVFLFSVGEGIFKAQKGSNAAQCNARCRFTGTESGVAHSCSQQEPERAVHQFIILLALEPSATRLPHPHTHPHNSPPPGPLTWPKKGSRVRCAGDCSIIAVAAVDGPRPNNIHYESYHLSTTFRTEHLPFTS